MEKHLQLTAGNETELPELAAKILAFSPQSRLYCFFGEMGAGKTTLIKELARQLGCAGPFSSPTFSLINVYASPRGNVYHCDLYRLKDLREVQDLGLQDIIEGNSYVFVEWPQQLIEAYDPSYVRIEMSVQNGQRVLQLSEA